MLFYVVIGTTLLGGAFAFGLYSGVKRNVIYDAVHHLKTSTESAIRKVSKEAGTITRMRPDHFLQPARGPGEGVTINTNPDNGELILLSGFFEDANGLRLIRRDGTTVASWRVQFYDIFPNPTHSPEPPATNWNVDIHGALALPDGSVVFSFEYNGLVKLDRCGNIVWTLPVQSHHSVERAGGGGFWVPGRKSYAAGSDSPFRPFVTPFDADTIMRVSDDGKLLDEILVPQLFYENGLEAVLTSTGHWFVKEYWKPGINEQWDREIVHLNKITELPRAIAKDFPMFKAGDLALSIRDLNLVMVIDPATREIKWRQEGPWLRQHDPEFKSGGTIVVFNNNAYATAFKHGDRTVPVSPQHVSNIVEINPATNEYRILYGDPNTQAMLSIIRGKLELTENGGLLVTEFEGGRVFETDATGHIVWEYINRYDAANVAEISEARLYGANYFSVPDWSCK